MLGVGRQLVFAGQISNYYTMGFFNYKSKNLTSKKIFDLAGFYFETRFRPDPSLNILKIITLRI